MARLLRNPLYAGHLAYPEEGGALSRADVPSAISLEMHQRILRRLDNAKGGERLNRTPDFPAQGFLARADRGDLMTACWSKGKKELYLFYLCKNHGCFSKRKSVPPEAIHDGIETLMEELVPSPEALAVFEAFAEAATLRLSSNATHDRDDLKRPFSALSDQHRRLLGSRLIEFHSQKRTVAASMIAEKKVSGHRSYRVATYEEGQKTVRWTVLPTIG